MAYDDIDLCPSPHVAGVAILRSALEEAEEEEKAPAVPAREMTMQERMAYEKRTADADLAFQAFERGRKKGKKGGKAKRRAELELAAQQQEEEEDKGPELNPIEKLRKIVTGEKS